MTEPVQRWLDDASGELPDELLACLRAGEGETPSPEQTRMLAASLSKMLAMPTPGEGSGGGDASGGGDGLASGGGEGLASGGGDGLASGGGDGLASGGASPAGNTPGGASVSQGAGQGSMVAGGMKALALVVAVTLVGAAAFFLSRAGAPPQTGLRSRSAPAPRHRALKNLSNVQRNGTAARTTESRPTPSRGIVVAPSNASAPVVREASEATPLASPNDAPPNTAGPSVPQRAPRHEHESAARLASPAANDSVEDELALLVRARRSLAPDPAAALNALDEHAQRFPRSQLGQERTVLRIEALLASGRREEAVREARSFETHHPNSGHLPRLRTLLGEH